MCAKENIMLSKYKMKSEIKKIYIFYVVRYIIYIHKLKFEGLHFILT
jgi:hypothetical protein